MISIIIPIYNQGKKLADCLNGLLGQTEHDFEVIVVNDGSTDNSAKVAADFKPRFKQAFCLINQDNQGAPAARNRGAQKARGEYLLFLDADIRLKPKALTIFKNRLKAKPKAAYAYASFRFGLKKFKAIDFDGELLKTMPYIHTTSLIRNNVFPGFDEKLKRFQDWDLWLTLLEQGKTGIAIKKTLFTVKPGGTISSWLPSFAYKLAPGLKKARAYRQAEKIIKQKHGLD